MIKAFSKFGLLSLAVTSAISTSARAEGGLQWVNLQNPPFQILKNNSAGIEIQVGRMPLPKSAAGAVGSLPSSFTITTPSGKVVKEATLKEDFKISLANSIFTETGAYSVTVDCLFGELDHDNRFVNPETYQCWTQDIFIYSPAARNKINSLRADALAAEFAPVLSFAPQEQYLPSSLAFIFNQLNPNTQLNDQRVKIRDASGSSGVNQALKFSELFSAVKTQGNSNFMIDMGYEGSIGISGPSAMSVRFGEGKTINNPKANVVVYHSVIPSRTNNNIVYLNYHFLYAYDSKGGDRVGSSGSTGAAAHAFDRESVTLKLQVSGSSVTPVSVIFGAHLPDQTMAKMDGDSVAFQWEGGSVEIPWEQVTSVGNKHPVVYIARGSHAVFPKAGTYAVLFGGTPFLTEDAGGGDVVLPQNLTNAPSERMGDTEMAQKKYQLRNLEIMDFNPKNDTSVLTFSGSWVTIFFGKPDAKFPPFTDREIDPDDYSSRAAKPGKSVGVPALNLW